MGILFAFIALLSWGFGDFLIQRSARKFGDWIALFYITAFGSLVLLPFIWGDLTHLFIGNKNLEWFVILLASTLMLLTALFEFEAFRVGKISAIEPVMAFEVPITAALATYIIREHLSWPQTALVVVVMVGIFLVSTRSFSHFRKHFRFETGVIYALLATIGMGTVNFLFGVGSREVSPLFINWFTSLFITIAALLYLTIARRWGEVKNDFVNNKKLIFIVSVVDNLAWVAYAVSVLYIPIAIAIGISESYVALAATLGLIFNKEKLSRHQYVGLVIVVIAVIILAIITEQ